MSIGIEFEKSLLALLQDEITGDNIEIIKEIKYDAAPNNVNVKTSSSVPVYDPDTGGYILAPAVSLFMGICVGVGLASHALILQWN